MDTTIQIRTSSVLKKKALKVFKKEGVTMSSVFNAFLEEVAHKGSVSVTSIPSPVVREWRKQMEIDLKTKKSYASTEEMWEDSKNW